MNKKLLIVLATLVVAVAVFAGIGFDAWRAAKRSPVNRTQTIATRPPLPQWGALLPEAENVEVSGSAMCGYCTWKVGEAPDNLVLQMSTEPGIVFVVGNEKRTEIEKLTGTCAGGDYYITARGTISQYNGHNYLLVKNFDALKTK